MLNFFAKLCESLAPFAVSALLVAEQSRLREHEPQRAQRTRKGAQRNRAGKGEGALRRLVQPPIPSLELVAKGYKSGLFRSGTIQKNLASMRLDKTGCQW
jgi:hypothetical protein